MKRVLQEAGTGPEREGAGACMQPERALKDMERALYGTGTGPEREGAGLVWSRKGF